MARQTRLLRHESSITAQSPNTGRTIAGDPTLIVPTVAPVLPLVPDALTVLVAPRLEAPRDCKTAHLTLRTEICLLYERF